eukprot:s1164_g8.t1
MGLQHALAMLGGIITPPSLISGDACFAWQLDQELACRLTGEGPQSMKLEEKFECEEVYWGGGVFCAENDMSRAAAFGAPQVCTGNGDVALPYGDVHYFGLGLSVMIFLVFIQAVGSPFMKNCSVALALFFGFFVAGVSSYTAEDGTSLPYVNSDKIDQAGVFTFLWTALFALLETSHSFLLQKPISTVEASTASVGETTTFNIGFYPPAFIPLLLGFVITAVETVGDIQASCDVSGLPIEGPDADSRIQGGLLADGEFANVLVSGINIVGGSGQMGRRTRFILAVSLGVGVGVAALPNWAEGGGLAGFHGGNLKHNIGLWPAKDDVCKVFPTEEYESQASQCTKGAYTASSMSEIDCTGMGGTYTAPVMATRTVTTCIGNNGNCCVQYDDSRKMWRDSLIIILKTPYCIGTLLALFLHLLLPFEMEEEEVAEPVQEKPSAGELNL